MTDEQHVLELLQALDLTATPVQTPRDLDPVWQTITTRIERGEAPQISEVALDLEQRRTKETEMSTLDTKAARQQDQRSRLRPALIAAAIVALVAMTGAALLLTARDTTPDVVVDSSGVPNTIRTSLAALEAGDYEAWQAVRSHDAVLSDGSPVVDDSPMRRVIARQGELDLQISINGCEETTEASATTTRTFECRIEGSHAIMRTDGLIQESDWTYILEDGRIAESPPPFFGDSVEAAQVLNDLVKYLREVDRARLDELCNSSDLDFFDAQIGPDCTRFITEHLDGFAAQRSTQP